MLLSTDITQNMSHSNKSWTWSNNSIWIWKIIVDETGEIHKSSHLQMFFKLGVHKKSMIFAEKQLCWSLFLIKMQVCNFINEIPTQEFSCEYCKIFKSSIFYRTPLVASFGCSYQSKIFWEITTSKIQGQHAVQFSFCRYESLHAATKPETLTGCFQWNFSKF